MDLIEVLWKQDVDLGFSLDLFNSPKDKDIDADDLDCLEKLKAVAADDDPPSKVSTISLLGCVAVKMAPKVSTLLSCAVEVVPLYILLSILQK
ncbi:hypothetical protein PR048_025299 [Dryococelus australis]|uniref:Uncharacterized protein n=1 Tax=Dryococelus australis TaxID=614101 RepID=A0ABQ9GQX0_9NEOP|nr:hypothetical protein PR048_025299 [Dryococelus australis]